MKYIKSEIPLFTQIPIKNHKAAKVKYNFIRYNLRLIWVLRVPVDLTLCKVFTYNPEL